MNHTPSNQSAAFFGNTSALPASAALSIHSEPRSSALSNSRQGLRFRSPGIGQPFVPVPPHPREPYGDIGTRFGQKLRELRRSHKMTQTDLAVLLGIDRSYISEVECGKKGISLATLEIIALGFHVPLSDLLSNL